MAAYLTRCFSIISSKFGLLTNTGKMNKLLLCLLFITGSLSASSQRVYFIYLQSEQDQPFFVRMNETVYSSTASGYTILSRLKDSTYQFSVGFPQNKWPEQRFTINIKAKDHGFILKNFGEKGWGLFDLQTLNVLMASNETKETIKMEKKEVSAFTDILAKASDDPSLRERPVFATRMEEKRLLENGPSPCSLFVFPGSGRIRDHKRQL